MVEVFDTFRSKYEDYGRGNKRNIYKGMNDERLAYEDRKKAKPIAEAYLYGKTQGRETASNPIALANIAYSTKSDIGNQGGNDGWNFKGRGLLQVTGRGNYEKIQKVIDKLAPESKVNVFDSVPESGYTPHQAAITGMAEWVEKSLYALASQSTKNNDDKIVNNIVNVLNEKTDSRAKRIVHYRGGSATATISGSSKKVNYTAPKDKNGNPKYKSTKEIFKIDECILLTGEKKEKKEERKRAPWMEYAIPEIGVSAMLKGDNPRINEYFNKSSNGKGLNESTNWCGAFVSWCFASAGYTPPPLSCRAAMWQFWKQLKKPIYGAAAVIDWGTNELAKPNGVGGAVGGDGHITFVVGISKDGKYYYCLGGNQGGVKGARKVKISKYSKSDIDWFVIPPEYKPDESEYELKIMNSEADIDTESTTRSN